MDGNLNNKVYINPNFKRPLINTGPFVYPNITNLHKCFPQQIQNDKLSIKKKSNRRIYVNPNFKQVKQEKASYSTATERHEKDENIDAYPKLISKSKYSLVTNINKSKVDEINTIGEKSYNHSMNTMHKANIFYNQNICTQNVLNDKYQKGDSIIKSRYSIVRKNKVVSEDKREIKPLNLKEGLTDTVQKFPSRSSNLDTCYSNFNNSLLKNQENKRSDSKLLQNIAKIKISKYKTVPITYLKKNLSSNKAKSNSSTSLFHTNTEKSNRVEFPFNNNRYKLTRSSSKPIVNIVNPSKTFIQIVNKSVWNNQSKIKLLKANFKVNNVPCRLFTKYGKCLRKDYGKCEYLHDKKHVSLCRKFLKGICHDSNCPLSHELTANKMPTCFFYLKGICTKEKCPYLHIKLNEKTKICHNFTEGYCAKGDTCKFRHVKLNQSKKAKFYNSFNSLQNKSTKLKKGTIKNVVQKKNITLSDKKSIKSQNKEQSNIDCRYYKEMVTNEGTYKNIKPTRCKIGTLPSFIQL